MEFIASKIAWVFLSPGNLIVLLMLIGGFLGLSQNAERSHRGRILTFNVALVLFLLSVLPIDEWVLTPLENRYPPVTPHHVDGIILLGGDEKPYISEARGIPIALDSSRRYISFAALAHEYPKAKLVFSGGSGLLAPTSTMKDAEVARAALKSLGVPVDRMVFEDQSRNTRENATMSATLLHPTPQQNWLLVTSAYHMPRAMETFRQAGFKVYPAPVGYMTSGNTSQRLSFDMARHITNLTLALHEYVGLIAYRMMGYVRKWHK